MAEEGVKTYLAKHKISSLFEDLRAKLVKELPADPVDFLIKKLQFLQGKKKKGSPHVSSISPQKVSRGGMEVTGSSAVSKTPANAKSPVSDRLSKSTSGLRPLRPKTTLSSSSASSLSKTTPTRPRTSAATSTRSAGASGSGSGTRIPAASSRATTTRPAGAGAGKEGGGGGRGGGMKVASRIPGVTSRHAPASSSSRPSTAPASGDKQSPMGTQRPGKTSSSSVGKKLQVSKKGTSGTVSSTPSQKQLQSSSLSSIKGAPRSGDAAARKEVESSVKGVESSVKGVESSVGGSVSRREAKAEEIAEFFGEARKSSTRQFGEDSEEEEEGSSGAGLESEGTDSDTESEMRVSGHVSQSKDDSGINLWHIMEERRCKHGKKSRRSKQGLPVLVSKQSTHLSLGYDEETSSDDEEGGAEVVEDPDALRDEGVEVTSSRYTITKSPAVQQPAEVVLCSRCARAVDETGGQEMAGGLEIESASQVGSQVSYPQWGSEAEQTCTSEGEQDLSSQVTLTSQDTWGGLAPPGVPAPQLSDEESEVQLPPPPPLPGHTWISQTPTQRDVHGWGQQT